ncbi:MAG: DEAD/DEAH box helicase [Candidatus Anammoxibacter sp.]
MAFNKFGLSKKILKAITDQGYKTPTPIQSQAIPLILNNQDVMGTAQTGTGKTAGFTLPMLQRLTDITQNILGKREIRALILTPTRELAMQVEYSIQTYGKYLPLSSAVVYGGVNINPQLRALKKGVDILVATPGRLLDHIKQKTANLGNVNIFVLDEADRMLDMGFLPDIRKIISKLPQQRQTLFFSATMSNEIKHLASQLLNSPKFIEVAQRNTPIEIIDQLVYKVDRDKKTELLYDLIATGKWEQVLVFTRTKHGADKLTKKLCSYDISATAIHGNKQQGARTKALSLFKNGGVRVLVATDVAARGLDIDQLPHVVNFEIPNVPEDYVHRIGRTGRAGNKGTAISLVCVDELIFLENIEKLIKREIPKKIHTGFEPDPSIRAQPIRLGRSPAPTFKQNSGKRGKTSNRGAGSTSKSKTTPSKKRNDDMQTSDRSRTRTDTRSKGKTTTWRKWDTNIPSNTKSRTRADTGNIPFSKSKKSGKNDSGTKDSVSKAGIIQGRGKSRTNSSESFDNSFDKRNRSKIKDKKWKSTFQKSETSSKPNPGKSKYSSSATNKQNGSSYKPKAAPRRGFSKPKTR